MRKRSFETLVSNHTWQKGMRHLMKSDRKMAEIISRFGSINREWGPSDPYEAIVESFIYQQIAGSAAEAIANKFRGLYGGRFPKPREFLRTSQKRVRGAGISPQKYSYIKDLCERLVRKELDLKTLSRLPDEEVIAILDDVKGIGRWTAEMFLMFSLRRVDVFPLDDLGIQNAVRRVYGLRSAPSREKLKSLSERWAPYRSIASLYLWKSQDTKTL
ncbi:MAG: DNA-3-methyladenine glycosylase 2 family protein [Candidatus Marsarchaeota archaeon]|nr:DNA-3-methyladenine glycosylase 2 family protein [Candidatus Marsarchaeota archaeon]